MSGFRGRDVAAGGWTAAHAARQLARTREDLLTEFLEGGVDLSVRQMCAAWRVMCRDAPGLRVSTADGIDYIFSGLPVAFFNVAILTQPSISASALRACGHAAREWAAETPVPWFFVVTHDSIDPGVDVAAILGECGLGAALPLTGMCATHVAPAASVPAGLQVTVPGADAECATLVDINSAAYEMDLEPAKAVLGRRAFWNDHVAVLGSVDGAPASGAAVLMVDGYRYVALVATAPAHRRRGYAEAVMRRALDVAASAHGERPTVLHATDAGRPIYARMGYVPIATHTLYMDAALLSAH
jgi:GNAT superfamily N-acetyltransferase